MRIAGTVLSPVLLTTVLVGVAGAQEQCQLDESRFGRQILTIQQARSANNSDQTVRHVSTAVRDLSGRSDFPAERAYFLAQAFTAWINRADLSNEVTRGQVGLAGDPAERIDLEQQIDSLLTAVEAARPECAATVDEVRRSAAWARLVTAAFEQYQRNEHDEAAATARRSLRLYAGMPYGYNILAGIAQNRGEREQAIEFLKGSVRTAEGDTTFTDIYHQALYGIGSLSADLADDVEGAQKSALLQQARDAYSKLLAAPDVPEDLSAAARQGIARLAVASGDTASVRAMYSEALANPDAHDFRTLLLAGAAAAEVDQMNDALQLFEAARAKNQLHRDVLANLVFVYSRSDNPARALPLAQQLVSVDPSNAESLKLAGQAYAAVNRQLTARSRSLGDRANRTTNARLKTALIDSAAAVGDSIRTISDLAVRYTMNADDLAGSVSITNMATADGAVTLRGTITNVKGPAARFTTRVELLDATGAVVGTQEVSVGPVQPGAAERFAVTLQAPTAVAFRYAPLTVMGQ